MAATYTLIASNTLSSSAASVTFSAIPNTYTDLVLKWSVRGTTSAASVIMNININGTALSQSSRTELRGDGATASSARNSGSVTNWISRYADAASATANTFANGEIYIPNYAGSANKVSNVFNANENNSTTAYIETLAQLLQNTAAITSIALSMNSGNIDSGSSFFLYGIKNS